MVRRSRLGRDDGCDGSLLEHRAASEPSESCFSHRAPACVPHLRDKGPGGEQLTADFYEAAREPKELWEIPDAGHTGGITARPDEYERRVIGFFADALLAGK